MREIESIFSEAQKNSNTFTSLISLDEEFQSLISNCDDFDDMVMENADENKNEKKPSRPSLFLCKKITTKDLANCWTPFCKSLF